MFGQRFRPETTGKKPKKALRCRQDQGAPVDQQRPHSRLALQVEKIEPEKLPDQP